MKKQLSSLSVLALSALAAGAGDVAQTVLTEPVVTGVYASNDGASTSLTFVVESPDAGSYFPAFWLCPAQYFGYGAIDAEQCVIKAIELKK